MSQVSKQYQALASAALRGHHRSASDESFTDGPAGASWSKGESSGESAMDQSAAGMSVAGVSVSGMSLSDLPEGDAGLPTMPPIGRAESYYVRRAEEAERHNDHLSRDAAKVGQYVTLAMNPRWDWPRKQKCFDHVLRRHCRAPSYADDGVWRFYRRLVDVVRDRAGHEALRLASAEDDRYAVRQSMRESAEAITADAEAFFGELLCCGDDCPKWFSEGDWKQVKLLRDQWV